MDPSAANAEEIFDQGAELDLLAALVPHLRERSVVDVGTERGAVAAALHAAGFGPLWLLEPFPGNVAHLHERFGSEPGVEVLEVAAAAHDGTAELHLAQDPSGESKDAFHSLLPRRSSPDLRWQGSLPVRTRSLGSLCAAGEIPSRLGLLKIDTEGADADVLRGAGGVESEIVMVEFWRDLPDTSGPCPYTLEEVRSLVEPLGPRRCLFVAHGSRHVSVGRWDVAEPATGEWGNLVFVADSLVDAAEAALPAIDRAITDRDERATADLERAAVQRLESMERLEHIATERLELMDELTRATAERENRIDGLERTAAERLELIDELHGTAAQRGEQVERLTAELREARSDAERRLGPETTYTEPPGSESP